MSSIQRRRSRRLSPTKEESPLPNDIAHSHAPSEDEVRTDATLTAVSGGALQLMGLQVFSRGTTFLLNQLLIRLTSPTVLGIVSVQLELILSTVLFLSREGIRLGALQLQTRNNIEKVNGKSNSSSTTRSIQRSSVIESETQQLVNAGSIAIPIGVLLATLAAGWVSWGMQSLWPYQNAIQIYLIAAVIELFSEPVFLVERHQLNFNLRVKLEGAALLAKCLTTLGLLYWWSLSSVVTDVDSVLAFAFAQLAFACTLTLGYFIHGRFSKIKSLRPQKIIINSRPQFLGAEFVARTVSFTKQAFIKHLLTEGDKIALSGISNDYNQGIYAFVANYGSLFARIVFLPLEEAARSYFSKIVVVGKAKPDPRTIVDYVGPILRVNCIIAILFGFIGVNYTRFFVHILAGDKWLHTEAPEALAVYLLYVPTMGINGILEAFLHSTASSDEISRQNRIMFLFWIIYIGCCYLFMIYFDFGAIGLIAANIINMLMRILYAWNYFVGQIRALLNGRRGIVAKDSSMVFVQKDYGFFSLLPSSPITWIYFILAFGVSRVISGHQWSTKVTYFVANAGSGFVLVIMGLVVFWKVEKDFKEPILRFARRKKNA